ncbi:MAG: biopolymer transporter ExbD [Deltaproteobacteria bacterium]|nr:biopolymer transporter ExbD [Deltaproteobacteria bacterium]
MARLGRIRPQSEEETELNMVPIMNMFMVLIPFLLMSASFYQIKAINTSIPVHADTHANEVSSNNKTEKITVVLELKEKEIRVSGLSETPNDLFLSDLKMVIPREPGLEAPTDELVDFLKALKSRYPSSDTLILIPDEEVLYREIVQTMDSARDFEKERLFPNIVISGSLG